MLLERRCLLLFCFVCCVSVSMPRVTDNYEYNTEDVLGSGSVCTVYRGHAVDTGELVAVKVIRAGMEEGLQKEAADRTGIITLIRKKAC